MLGEADESLFTRWLEKHSASIIQVARAYTLNSDECQDLAQEILLQAWRSLSKFEGKSSPATWFYRVALHTAMNWQTKGPATADATANFVGCSGGAVGWIGGFRVR